VEKESIRQAALKRARDLAGGVSYLGRKLGVGADALDAMMQGREPVPSWVFLRAVDFINDAESRGMPPPGMPAGWLDADPDTTPH
jgi:hypothetical protein